MGETTGSLSSTNLILKILSSNKITNQKFWTGADALQPALMHTGVTNVLDHEVLAAVFTNGSTSDITASDRPELTQRGARTHAQTENENHSQKT